MNKMENYKEILAEWDSNIEKYPKFKIKEAKKIYTKISECIDEDIKKQLRNDLITNTLYVVLNFVKVSGLIYLNSCLYDMSDIISVCIEIWISKIDSGILLNINSFKEMFDSDFYNKLSEGLNITKYSISENTIFDIYSFMDLLFDYIKLKEKDCDFNYYDLIEYMKNNWRYQILFDRISYYSNHTKFIELFDAIIDSFELSDEDLNISKTRLEKIKYIIINNGLEYLRTNIDRVDCSDTSDLVIQEYCRKKIYKIVFESDILNEIQKDILKKRYCFYDGNRWTLEEIAKYHGVTKERIRQREVKSLRILRNTSFLRKYKDLI